MSRGEISERLILAVRDGRIDERNRGLALGYARAVKRENEGGKGPSWKQEKAARTLVHEVSSTTRAEDYVVDYGDAPLIDREDKPVTVSPRPTNTREAWNPELWK